MKRPIEWHRQRLTNQLAYKKHLEEKLARETESARAEISRIRDESNFLHLQISEAVKRGMNEFDQERLLVKRGKKI